LGGKAWKSSEKHSGKYPIQFVGAGPGDPDLITVKGRSLLKEADVIVYTGSLVPKAVLGQTQAEIHNSAGMHLEEIISLMVDAFEAGKRVVRLHTGDPSLYSAIAEQIALLRQHSIPYNVVPGVTAGFAASAALGCELTLPERVQTVIISRVTGRTPVPEKESLETLSRIRASLILYLSVARIRQVTKELLAGYPSNTPVAVVEKATWPDERIITGTLEDIATKVEEAGIRKTAVILVGEALEGIRDIKDAASKLYDKGFSHGFRQGVSPEETLVATFSPSSQGEKGKGYIVYLGEKGKRLANSIKAGLEEDVELIPYGKLKGENVLGAKWNQMAWIIFIGACQIAVRTIAPHISSKYTDPAVVAVDESGKNVVCLLSGHIGGGNELATKVANILGARPVITTQSDIMGLPALDLWARANHLVPISKDSLKELQARFRDEGRLRIFLQPFVTAPKLPKGFTLVDNELDADVIIGPFLSQTNASHHQLITRNIHLGTGCHKGYSPELLRRHACQFLRHHGIQPLAVKSVCTLDKKSTEPAIVELARYLEAELKSFPPEELNKVPVKEASEAVMKAVGTGAVSEPAALLCSGKGDVIVEKQKYDGCTFSLAANEVELTNNQQE